MGCGCGKKNKLRFVATDPTTGDCVVTNDDGDCTKFASPAAALRAAAAAGHPSAGFRQA